MRWDRSGCIVTQRFEYHDDPGGFAESLWHYDRSVTLASRKQRQDLQEVLEKHPHLYFMPQIEKFTGSKVRMGGRHYFIANKPVSCADLPLGRAMRGYVVFLGDSWRVGLPRMIPQSTTYGVSCAGECALHSMWT
jgi:hypothetical protein